MFMYLILNKNDIEINIYYKPTFGVQCVICMYVSMRTVTIHRLHLNCHRMSFAELSLADDNHFD